MRRRRGSIVGIRQGDGDIEVGVVHAGGLVQRGPWPSADRVVFEKADVEDVIAVLEELGDLTAATPERTAALEAALREAIALVGRDARYAVLTKRWEALLATPTSAGE